MGDLVFRPEDHTYWVSGRLYVSVTQVLQQLGLIRFDGIPPSVLDAAKERGTVVHQAVHYFNERDLDVDGFCATYPTYAGYLQAWIAFTRLRQFQPVLCEHRVASRRHQVAGTLDCLGLLDGQAVLLDFATGDPADVCKWLQTAAYEGLAREWAAEDPVLARFFGQHKTLTRAAVALRKDGTFTVEPYRNPADYREFLVLRDALAIVEKYRRGGAEVAA
jgi:hypothetical protein